MNVIWLFNSQYPLNLNFIEYVLYINRFELKVESVGAIKFKYAIKILKLHFQIGL